MAGKRIVLSESEDGVLYFDTEKCWFYFRSDELNNNPIMMYRIGNFDLTPEEKKTIRQFIAENLKDGVLQS